MDENEFFELVYPVFNNINTINDINIKLNRAWLKAAFYPDDKLGSINFSGLAKCNSKNLKGVCEFKFQFMISKPTDIDSIQSLIEDLKFIKVESPVSTIRNSIDSLFTQLKESNIENEND
jgi:hypothetical protein